MLGVMLLSLEGMGQTISILSSKSEVCEGESFNLTINSNQKIWFYLEVYSNSGPTWTRSSPNVFTTGSSANWTYPFSSISISENSIYRIKYSTVSGLDLNNNPIIDDDILNIFWNPLPNATVAFPSTICNGASVLLGATAVAGNTYSWSSNVGTYSSTESNPSVSPTSTRTYTLTETITATGCEYSNDVLITVNPLPTATFVENSGANNNDAVICAGDVITAKPLIGNSLNFDYTWNLPNGNVNNGEDIYPSSGNYGLYITDKTTTCQSSTITISVVVNALPTLTITNPSAVCAPGTVDLTATAITAGSTSSLTYTYWTNNTATTSLANAGTISTTGPYYIKGTNPTTSCFKIEPVVATVNPLPTVAITNPSAVCAPGTVDLTATAITAGSTSSLTYTYWTNNTATTSLANAGTISTTGPYYIKGTNPTTSCFKIEPVVATVNPLPTVAITNPSAVCAPGTVDLTATAITAGSTSSLTYTYFTNAAATTSLSTASAGTISTTGSYYIKGTNPTTSCFKIEPVTATVNALPTLTITNPTAICAPGTVDLTATSITAGSTASLTYTYFTNAAATTSLANANTISTTGAYYIKGTTALNCSAIKAVNATVNPIPTFNLTSPSVCLGATLTITANPITGAKSDYNYIWQVPSGVSNPANVSNFTTTTSGVYTATIKNKTTNCESAFLNTNAIFYPLPIAKAIVASDNKVIVNKTLNLTAAASGGTSPYKFTWTPSSTMNYSISGQENAVFNAIKEGKVNIKFQVKDENNCEANSGDYEITIESEDIVLVLPNAFTPNGDGKNDEFKIVAINTLGQKSFLYFEIYNRNGKLLTNKITDYKAGWNGRSLAGDMQDMGVYFVKLVKLNKDGIQVVETTPIYLLK